MTSTITRRRRLPMWLCVALGVLAVAWIVLAFGVAAVDDAPPGTMRLWLLASELAPALLLAATAAAGTRQRPGAPTPLAPLAIAVVAGVLVAAVAVIAAAVGKAHHRDVSGQILYATVVAVAFFAVIRSKPA